MSENNNFYFDGELIIKHISNLRDVKISQVTIIDLIIDKTTVKIRFHIRDNFFLTEIKMEISEYKKLLRSDRLSKILN